MILLAESKNAFLENQSIWRCTMYKDLTEQQISEMMPQEITSVLYEACIDKLDQAVVAIDNKYYFTANKLLQSCNDILYRLGAGIKYEAGPIADQLDNLYNYCAETLLEANLNKDKALIQVVRKIIEEISMGWQIAMDKGSNDAAVNKKVMAYQAYEF